MSESEFGRPSRPASFVAYEKRPRRVGDPESGTAISARPEVFVREYPSIRVAKVETKESSSNGGDSFRTLSVEFDAASAKLEGFKKNFGGVALADSDVGKWLESACQKGKSVYVALETRRKARDNEGKQISPLTPIHTLRGASDGKTNGNANVTQSNCVNIIAAVGVADDQSLTVWSPEIKSDPHEWSQLRENRLGGLPPDGWRRLMKDGSPAGAITPLESSGTTAVSDAGNLAAVVEAAVRSVLQRAGFPVAPPKENKPPQRRPQQTVRATEPKEWEPIGTDGTANPGGWLMSKWRATFCEARGLVQAVLPAPGSDKTGLSPEQVEEHIWAVADMLLTITDHVQAAVIGKPNRVVKSHFEAGQWVLVTIGDLCPFTGQLLTDVDARRKWARAVRDHAARRFRHAYADVSAWLKIDVPVQSGSKQERTQPRTPQADAPEAPEPANPWDSAPNTKPTMAAQDPAALAAYEALLVEAGEQVAQMPDAMNPLLTATFGEWEMSKIPADQLTAQIEVWRRDAAAFRQAGRQAWVSMNSQAAVGE